MRSLGLASLPESASYPKSRMAVVDELLVGTIVELELDCGTTLELELDCGGFPCEELDDVAVFFLATPAAANDGAKPAFIASRAPAK